jgi:N-acetylglutamate synthase-like GNAT family acetyltransferase
MAIRKHRAGELVIEQTRDLALLRAMLARGGLMTDGIEWRAACYLVAYFGDDAIGVIGVEPKIDAALIRSLYVDESMRRRGIGAALVAAARKAAHTRGARHLYLFSTGAGEFFERHGFAVAPVADVVAVLRDVPQVEFYRAHSEELAREVAYHLDISADGVIER